MIIKKLIGQLATCLWKLLTPRSGISSRRLVLLLTLVQFFGVEWFCLVANRQVQEELLLYPMIIILSGLGVVSVDSFKGLVWKKPKQDNLQDAQKTKNIPNDDTASTTQTTRPLF